MEIGRKTLLAPRLTEKIFSCTTFHGTQYFLALLHELEVHRSCDPPKGQYIQCPSFDVLHNSNSALNVNTFFILNF